MLGLKRFTSYVLAILPLGITAGSWWLGSLLYAYHNCAAAGSKSSAPCYPTVWGVDLEIFMWLGLTWGMYLSPFGAAWSMERIWVLPDMEGVRRGVIAVLRRVGINQ
jgi:hypothetical protein